MTAVRLYDWGPSPFCLKVRAILDHKRVDYERVSILGPSILEVQRRGTGKVPALELDGTLVTDSTDIAYALEERFPEPGIVPADPALRARCHLLEDWADEALYFIGLYLHWWEPRGAAQVPRAFGRSPIGLLFFGVYKRRVHRQLFGQGTARKSLDHVLRDLDRHLDALSTTLGDGPYFLGDEPLLCDFALLGQLVYLGHTPVGGERLQSWPTLQDWLERMRALRRPRDGRPQAGSAAPERR